MHSGRHKAQSVERYAGLKEVQSANWELDGSAKFCQSAVKYSDSNV